jgi:3-oxoacyl-[acyl-carrier protein] reductase
MALLDGKATLITGAGDGLGKEMARTFAAEGAPVVIADINVEAAEKTAAEIVAQGSRAIAIGGDVTSEADVDAMVARCVGEFGALDVMVNNAGITRDATMRKMSLADFRLVIDVHLQGVWLGTRAAAAAMRERNSGSIINMSSISGKVGNPGQTNYSAAKAGIVGLTKAAAKELAHLGIRVNAIQPGIIRTAMTAAMRPDVLAQRIADIPLGRMGEPVEVATAALFLASGLSSYITGTVIEVSGGRHI